VNGELYESEKVRAELGGLYSFKGNSDCENVIALYLHYGIHFLSKLRGEFALCLYDARRQLFIAARDRYGVKPLFWTIQDKRLLVASEAKAFLPFGWKPEWDIRSLMEDGWLHDERTIFKGVNKVCCLPTYRRQKSPICVVRVAGRLTSDAQIQPGHYLICSSFSHMAQREYWDLDFPDKVSGGKG
jgi:asparagine synthase (glutamine-hydrolysing)